ncbi:preprotein translocase subunit SecA [Fictibacillus macauensis ZFHKF-1]|uniref:Protein translocase subunit SecA n=1 Tax=Fictibacillus macauensis ZFHKF-1 TaxID=1196324 RepID=I8UJ39_9BACL|nr:accessory Sec system translocase SecA2 [Fictibacillus macauensis]EIT86905.1 preprotein translocase subunit SecA [Fictibacillus macauensis ZFHKF-1]
MLGIMKKVSESVSSTAMRKFTKQLQAINALEQTMSSLSDEKLQQKTIDFKNRLSTGATLEDIKIEAFAVVREASKRVTGQRHYDVQLLGGLVLHEGRIAEMQTGEGKTLVASLPSYLNALSGRGVHVITVNEYLARRDYETIGKIHQFLGLTVGLNTAQLSNEEKQAAYLADITYGTGNEFGFDYLRDHMILHASQKVQRPLSYAIIDEIDSILIDEARTPLIIANKSQLSADLFYITNHIVSSFKEKQDYEYVLDSKQLFLTEAGINAVERAFGIHNLFDAEHQLLYHFILQSLRAHVVMKRDVDYIVRNGEVALVDSFTGRIMEGRSYSDGLQQAIEAKEQLEIKEENETQATITIQNYFRLYTKLAGMTGTASTEQQEFFTTYHLHVEEIPTNRPRQRVDFPDVIYDSLEAKYKAIIADIVNVHATGRPILIGTTSIEQSEELATHLEQAQLPYLVLNAKSEEQEARIIAMAGQKDAIMIATNMAGRGTDILLGEGVSELGGLHIIGTERHESQRIDLQLRGRAGRQGDPGSSRFILSLQDELFSKLEKEDIQKWTKKASINQDGEVTKPDPLKFINKVQRAVEGIYYSAREHLVKVDNVSDQHRKIVYALRSKLLEGGSIYPFITNCIQDHVVRTVAAVCSPELEMEEWPLAHLVQQLQTIFPEQTLTLEDFVERDHEEMMTIVTSFLETRAARIQQMANDNNEDAEQDIRGFMLRSLDASWLKHLETMNLLKEGMHLKSYAQEDPYRLFEKDAYEAFLQMNAQWQEEITLQFALVVMYSTNERREDH